MAVDATEIQNSQNSTSPPEPTAALDANAVITAALEVLNAKNLEQARQIATSIVEAHKEQIGQLLTAQEARIASQITAAVAAHQVEITTALTTAGTTFVGEVATDPWIRRGIMAVVALAALFTLLFGYTGNHVAADHIGQAWAAIAVVGALFSKFGR